MSSSDLTPKQQRFCEEYLIDLNATAAYRRAGYAAKTDNAAAASASALLRNPKVQAEVARLQAARSFRVRLTADDVLLRLRRLVLADFRKLYHPDGRARLPHEVDDDTAAAVASCESEEQVGGVTFGRDEGLQPAPVWVRKFKLWDNPRAVAMAMDHLGLTNKLTLETVFALLDPPVAEAFRRAIGEVVSGGRAGDSGGPAGGGG